MLSSQCKHDSVHMLHKLFTLIRHHAFSHSDVAYICVFWEEKGSSRHSFDRVLHSFRDYDLGDEQRDIRSVPTTLFINLYS